jgi:hypothetical protein
MPGIMPGIHTFSASKQDEDGRDKPGHDKGNYATCLNISFGS